MPKFNLRSTSVLFTGGLTAFIQYVISAGGTHISTWVGSLLTILVAFHGMLTTSLFANYKPAQEAAILVSEGEQILTNGQEK